MQTMIEKVTHLVTRLVLAERSPHKLASSFCVGVFVAFSPFLGLHNIMMLAVAWFGHLNFAMIYFSCHIFNNPLTMVPLYWLDHAVGEKICLWLFNSTLINENPVWIAWVNQKISCLTGLSGISFWAFIIGGNVLGLLIAGMLYPIMRWVFNRILSQETDKAAEQ